MENGTYTLENEGKTVVWVSVDQEVMDIIAVADTIKPEAHQAIAQLKKLGIKATAMVTGDNQRTAQSVGEMLNLDRVHAQLLPEDKLTVINQLEQQYQTVAMVGDGINDAPALAAATVGIAMGVGGREGRGGRVGRENHVSSLILPTPPTLPISPNFQAYPSSIGGERILLYDKKRTWYDF